MRRVGVVAVLTAAGLASGATLAAASEAEKLKAYGKHLSGECTTCHRIDGVDNGIPSIIGWPVDDFAATLKFYQDGARSNPAMVSVAQSLDDDQINALATYFGGIQKAAPQPAKATGTAKAGK